MLLVNNNIILKFFSRWIRTMREHSQPHEFNNERNVFVVDAMSPNDHETTQVYGYFTTQDVAETIVALRKEAELINNYLNRQIDNQELDSGTRDMLEEWELAGRGHEHISTEGTYTDPIDFCLGRLTVVRNELYGSAIPNASAAYHKKRPDMLIFPGNVDELLRLSLFTQVLGKIALEAYDAREPLPNEFPRMRVQPR